jgi:hypothetical protein
MYLSDVTVVTKNIRSSWDDILEKDPNLRLRIQGTIWYRDCVVRLLEQDICDTHLEKAREIEAMFLKNTGLLSRLQSESWWQKYLNGEIHPEVVLLSQIPASQKIDAFNMKNPDIYQRIINSPLWINLNDPHDSDDSLLVHQARYLQEIDTIKDIITQNDTIIERMNMYGITIEMLYSDSTVSLSNSVYAQIISIINIENTRLEDPNRYHQFIVSPI